VHFRRLLHRLSGCPVGQRYRTKTIFEFFQFPGRAHSGDRNMGSKFFMYPSLLRRLNIYARKTSTVGRDMKNNKPFCLFWGSPRKFGTRGQDAREIKWKLLEKIE
jgi:hypothetical protein